MEKGSALQQSGDEDDNDDDDDNDKDSAPQQSDDAVTETNDDEEEDKEEDIPETVNGRDNEDLTADKKEIQKNKPFSKLLKMLSFNKNE